jgi:hypothetical protein
MTSEERHAALALVDRNLRDAERALAEGNRQAATDLLAVCAALYEELGRDAGHD